MTHTSCCKHYNHHNMLTPSIRRLLQHVYYHCGGEHNAAWPAHFANVFDVLPSVRWYCWLGGRKGIQPVKNGGWWRWALVSPDGVAPSRMVGVSVSVNLSLHHKVQKFSSGTGSPGWSRKKGHKTVVVVCGLMSCESSIISLLCRIRKTDRHLFNSFFSRTTWVSWHQKG